MKKIFKSAMTLTAALAMVACGGKANNGSREAQELSQHYSCRASWCR